MTALPLAAALPFTHLDDARFLAAVAVIEDNLQDRITSTGERSIYGLGRKTWEQHMPGLPFELATSRPDLARECAGRHLRWLKRELSRRGLPQTPQVVGTCWNTGLRGFRFVTPYGFCVQAVYEEGTP